MAVRFTESLGAAHATIAKGMAGLVADGQWRAAESMVRCMTALDKVSRLANGTPTEIVESKIVGLSDEDLDAERERLIHEAESILAQAGRS